MLISTRSIEWCIKLENVKFFILRKKIESCSLLTFAHSVGQHGSLRQKKIFSQKRLSLIKTYSVGQGLSNGTTFSRFGDGRFWWDVLGGLHRVLKAKNFFSQKWPSFIKTYSVGQGLSNGTTFSRFGEGRFW